MSHVQAIQASGILFKEITRRGGGKKGEACLISQTHVFHFRDLLLKGWEF